MHTYLGQYRQDGTWSVGDVNSDKADDLAKKISDAPDGNTAMVLNAQSADEARGKLFLEMKKRHVVPSEPLDPSARWRMF